MIYLPDTNAVSTYLTGRDQGLVARLNAALQDLRLSVLVVAEREFGIIHHASGRRYRAAFDAFVQLVPVEPFTREDASFYASIRSQLDQKGRGIGPMDTLIAAQALRLGATLITHNIREFRRIPRLKVEDWQTP